MRGVLRMKKVLAVATIGTMLAGLLAGCELTNEEQIMRAEQSRKSSQAIRMIAKTPSPPFEESAERDNISQRLIITNDEKRLQWIYLISNGSVIGRTPVRGKVTSGSKRLSRPISYEDIYGLNGENYESSIVEAPDEMGAYGSSGDYIYWFSPNGEFNQLQGNYYLSSKPFTYSRDTGINFGVIDEKEEANRDTYVTQIEASLKEWKKTKKKLQQDQKKAMKKESGVQVDD